MKTAKKGISAEGGVVRARIDGRTKKAAELALGRMGISTSEAIRVFFMRIALEQKFPFPLEVPNAATLKAVEEVNTGQVEEYSSLEAFLNGNNHECEDNKILQKGS